MDIDTVLNDTVRTRRRSRFDWAGENCLVALATYLHALGYRDGAAEWRSAIDGRASALAALSRHGGGLRLLEGELLKLGVARAAEPRRGDVICVQLGRAEIGGLCLGDFCAFRAPSGVTEVRTSRLMILGAWRP